MRILGHECAVDDRDFGFQRHPTALAAFQDRIAGVDAQVHQHLVDLRRVAQNQRRVDVWQVLDGDGRGQQPPQHRRQLADARVQFDGPQFERLRPADREQLASQLGPAVRRFLDVVQLHRHRGIQAVAAGQRRTSEDHSEQVVEIMRDTARQQAEALQPLRLRQPPLQILLVLRGLALLLQEAQAPGRHRQLPGHAHQVIELIRGGQAHALVAESSGAERAERLVQQAQRHVDDRAVAQLRDHGLVGAWIGQRVLDDHRGVRAHDLFHHRVAGHRDGRGVFPQHVAVLAADAEQLDLGGALAVGDGQPGVLVAQHVAGFHAGDVEQFTEVGCALQFAREGQQSVGAHGQHGFLRCPRALACATPARCAGRRGRSSADVRGCSCSTTGQR